MSGGSRDGLIHGFGVDDPDDKVLSPIVWIPLVLVALVCCLFIALQRAKALQVYDDAKQYVLDRLPWTRRRGRGVALSYADLEAPRDSDDEEGSDDELPRSTNQPQQFSDSSVSKAMRVLGISSTRESYAGRNQHTPGIAQAFWGIRPQDRTGQIRLQSGPPKQSAKTTGGLGSLSGLLDRVTDLSGARRARADTGTSDGQSLFNVGNDDDEAEQDAVELDGADLRR